MKKFLVIIIFTLGILVPLTMIIFLFFQSRLTLKPTSIFNPVSILTKPKSEKTMATFFLSPATTTISQGERSLLDIKLRANSQTIVSMAVRLTLKYEGKIPLKPIGTKVKTNLDLIKSGWNYPVNQVSINEKTKTLTIDLLMANLEPGGFKINGEISLGTLEFTAAQSSSSAKFSFDPFLTTIKDKNGNSVLLNLESSNYTIY